jgi:hypothetical protein
MAMHPTEIDNIAKYNNNNNNSNSFLARSKKKS